MEKFILEQMAMELISKIKDINTSLKELETAISNYKTSKISYPNKIELKKIIRSIVEKLKSIIILSKSKFILPNKVIDNILIFFIKFLDILFTNKNLSYEKNIIAKDILPSLVNFLKIEQNYPNGMILSQFITSKWKFLENILKYSLAFVDIFENDLESSLECSQIVNIFDLVELIYFNLDSTEYKYKIMPGLISKILKVFTVIKSDLKIPSKILKMFVKIFNENVNVIFLNLEEYFMLKNNKLDIPNVEQFDAMHLKNFHTFFEFFDLFHSKLQERISKDKLMKIHPELVKLNLNSVQNYVKLNKNNFPKLKIDCDSIEKIFRNNFSFLTKLIRLENISAGQHENIINKEFFFIFSFLYKEEEILQKLNQDISKVSRMISRGELNVSLESIRGLFINLQLYLVKTTFDKNFEEIFINNRYAFNSILNNSNECESLNYLITKLLDDVYQKLFQVKSNPILEVVNTYEVQVNNITLEKSYENFSNYLDQCLKFGQENEYKIIMKIIKYTFDLYPQIRQHILNLILIKINTTTRKLKKILTNEDGTLDSISNETKKINIKEFISIFDVVLQELSLLLTICFIEKYNGKDFQQKQKILLKNLISFYASVLIEYEDGLKCISKTKLSLMNSLIMMMYAYLIPSGLPGDKLFTQQELNNVLIFALPNYCNRAGILKYSATFLMSCMINNKNNRDLSDDNAETTTDELNLKNFIYSNFHFVINTTIKKIIYFDYKRNKNNNNKNTSQISSLSNFKIDVLNLFNSLLLLLEEFKEDNLINFYCGELNKLTAKLFSFLDVYTKEKNFFALECLLEIIERITLLQKKVIEKNHAVFKVNHYEDYIVSEVDQDGSQFVSFLKEQIGIDDCNLFRNIILRILPLFLSNKISIQYICLKIFENLVSTLYLLPMSREEKKNFSTEDNSNVIVKSSLGPVMFEAWDYFIFLLGNKNFGDVKNILNKNFNFFGNIFNFFLVVAEYYPRFFNENRVFVELLKKIQENFVSVNKSFSSIQISKVFSPVFIFINRILELNFSHNCLTDNSKENLINFLISYSELILELKSSKKDIKFQRENMIIIPELNETINRIISKINKMGIISSANTQKKLDKLMELLHN